MPGAAWWVGKAEGVVSRGAAGQAALEPQRRAAVESTPFDLASLTKPLATAILALLLEREGLLDLDAPLAATFAPLAGSPFAQATLRDAATHRAGFPAWRPLYLAGHRRDDYVRAIAAVEPGAARGATLYSDLGYLLLGFAVESAGSESLERQFQERIGGPLRLARAGFDDGSGRFRDAAATERGNVYERSIAGPGAPSEGFREELICGEVHDGNAWGIGGVAGHAGLFAPAADVAAIAVAILEPVRLGLSARALDAMLVPEAGSGRTFGFALARETESVRGVLPDGAVGHLGFTGTSVWIDAARPRVYVLLTNRVHPRVASREFAPTRRGFHALAAAL